MPQTILYTDFEENKKIIEYQTRWNLSKAETMKRMIREFAEE